MAMQLRPYQNEAVTAIRREWSEGKQRTLLVLPTGGGKTVSCPRLLKVLYRKAAGCSLWHIAASC